MSALKGFKVAKKIGIVVDGLDGWGGGIRFIELIASALAAVGAIKNNDARLYLIKKSRLSQNIIYLIRELINAILNCKFPSTLKSNRNILLKSKGILEHIKCIVPSVNVLEYHGTIRSLNNVVKRSNIDCIALSSKPLGGLSKEWIGYIPDCQHKVFPEFFSTEQMGLRDKTIKIMLNATSDVICNGESVRQDIFKYYTGIVTMPNIHVLPFSPFLTSSQIQNSYSRNDGLLESYKLINNKYFIIANQFWAHKDHVTAFNAFKKFINFLKDCDEEWKLVCTGTPSDFRSPNYYKSLLETIDNLNLSNRIVLTGYIPQLDQLRLIAMSVAVVQPSLFEGGPGGGSVYDAVALGVPCLVTNIPINNEINSGKIRYFEPRNSEQLAELMKDCITDGPHLRPSIESLIKESFSSQMNLGIKLLEIIKNVRKNK